MLTKSRPPPAHLKIQSRSSMKIIVLTAARNCAMNPAVFAARNVRGANAAKFFEKLKGEIFMSTTNKTPYLLGQGAKVQERPKFTSKTVQEHKYFNRFGATSANFYSAPKFSAAR